MRNNFDKSIFFFWMDNRECWWCGREVTDKGERVDALHHILGRISNSILNSAPIHNFSCHLDNGKINHLETKKLFLAKTLGYLLSHDYKFKKKDNDFLEKFKEYYGHEDIPQRV